MPLSYWCILLFVCTIYAQESFIPGYKLQNLQTQTWGYQGELIRESSGPYGGDIDLLEVSVYFQTQDILRIRILDPLNERWEVPDVVQLQSPPESIPEERNYDIAFTHSPFGISVHRASNNEMIWNSTSPSSGNQFNGLIVSITSTRNILAW